MCKFHYFIRIIDYLCVVFMPELYLQKLILEFRDLDPPYNITARAASVIFIFWHDNNSSLVNWVTWVEGRD